MAQLTRKSYQRKAAAIGFGIFLTASLSATGFAAWAIASAAEEHVSGNVDIFTITDKSISIVLDPFTDENAGVVKFEPTEDDVNGRIRNDGKNFEHLGFTISGSVSPYEYVTSFTIRLDLGHVVEEENGDETVIIDEEAEERFDLAASEVDNEEEQRGSYITLPECWKKAIPVEDVNERRDPVRFSHHIEFGWGTAFEGMNPGKFFELREDEVNIESPYLVSDDDMRDTMYDMYTLLTGMPDEGVTELDRERGYTSLRFVITLVADTSGSHEDSSDTSEVSDASDDSTSEEEGSL